jgi:hypothetical protein
VLVGLVLLRGIMHHTRELVSGENRTLEINQLAPLRICNSEICWTRVERTSNIMISVIGVASAMVFIQMLSLLLDFSAG